ncbi:biopolymer transporter ExbD [Akkermansia muciniphila]|nr:biopolymer transporter ExbD [Akkermansia muciniphila]
MWVEGDVPHQRVIDVMNALTEAGITTVALTDLKND